MEDEVPDDIMDIQSNLRLYLAVIIIFNFILIFYLKYKQKAHEKYLEFIKSAKNKEILFILPKLENILLFYPSIITLLKQDFKIDILCLSRGGDENESDLLKNAIKIENISVCENDKLKDNYLNWDEKIISSEIDIYIKKNNNIGTIITFDENGIGKNNKFISCYNGLIHYLLNNKPFIIEKQIQIFYLDSFNWLNRSSFIFPALYFYFKLYGSYNASFIEAFKTAMKYKRSFLNKIALLLNCYTYFNSLTKIEFKE